MWLPVIGGIVNNFLKIIDKSITDKDLKLRLQKELTEALTTLDYHKIEKEIEARAKILAAEAGGHSWLQRNWRPLLMTVFTFIIAWNYAAVPILSCFMALHPAEIPPDMWALLKIGVGGYIFSRGAEKIVKDWPRR